MSHQFLFTDIYWIVNFDRIFLSVSFRAILMSFLNFLVQKTYPGEFLRAEVILSRGYLKTFVFGTLPLIIINLSFFKNAINSDQLGVRG